MTKAVKRTTVLFLLILAMSSWCCAQGSDPHTVGGYVGIPKSSHDLDIDHDGAYPSHCCKVGERVDISDIFCPHGMVQVTVQGFQDCNATNPVATSDDQTFLCRQPGDFYFICQLPYLCDHENHRFHLHVGHYEPKKPATATEPVRKAAPNSASPSPPSGTPQARPYSASGTPEAKPYPASGTPQTTGPLAFPSSGSSQASYMPKFGWFFSSIYLAWMVL